MSSGTKHLITNLRERAVSPDLNRMQAFAACDFAETMRRLLSGTGSSEDGLAVGYESATFTPLRGQIIGGLIVRPQTGTLGTLIDAGVVGVVNPDAVPSADDSLYKIINDPGITDTAALKFTANGPTGARIDVVECRRVDTVLEQEPRDIFNETTGLFTASMKDKVAASRLEYRIRLGTPTLGYPGNVNGWMPLMVAAVPANTATWDATVICWDVRPLVADSMRNVMRLTASRNRYSMAAMLTGTKVVKGTATSEHNGRYAGGVLNHGDTEGIDLASSVIREPGFTATANRPWYVYALFPCGLPRWVRYTAGPGPVPSGMFGIPVLSMVPPRNVGSGPSADVTLPTPLMFSGVHATTQSGALLFAGMNKSAGQPTMWLADGVVQQQEVSQCADSFIATTFSDVYAEFTFTAGTHFPRGARALYVKLNVGFSDGGTGIDQAMESFVTVYDRTNTVLVHTIFLPHIVYFAAGHLGGSRDAQVRIPIDHDFVTTATGKVQWRYSIADSNCTVTGASMQVVGWEMGP